MIHVPEFQGDMMSNLYWLMVTQMQRLRPYFPKNRGRARVDEVVPSIWTGLLRCCFASIGFIGGKWTSCQTPLAVTETRMRQPARLHSALGGKPLAVVY